jgi:glyoxylase-like metal-dependent hydrolase (beta-lactamase superfamily II)
MKIPFTTQGLATRSSLALLLGALLLSGCSGQSEPAAETADAASDMPAAAPAPTADALIDAAQDALGMDGMSSISYSGSAWRIRNSFRQTRTASAPWTDRDDITNYVRTLDLNQPVSRATGETFASNMFLLPPVAGTYAQNLAADQRGWGQQLDYWLTPWGFLQGAEQYGASLGSSSDGLTQLTWQSPADQVSPAGLRYTVNGYLDSNGLVRRVETWVDDAFMGDLQVINVYDNYQNLGGVQVPTTMEQQRGGGGIFGVNVAGVTVNPPNAAELLTIPPPPAPPGPPPGGAPAQPTEIAEQLAEGVYLLKTAYNSMLVEFADHVVAFEAGGSPAVGETIVAEAARLFPDKPLRYLINTHPHSDHTAGMIPVVRAGATIVTHEANIPFLQMALSGPRTLIGEETLNPQFMAAQSGVTVMEDATRRLELHHIPNLHSEGTIVMLLPNEGVLMQADFTLPVGGAAANPFVVNLAEYVDANNLQFERYLAVHASPVPQTRADLMAAIGK